MFPIQKPVQLIQGIELNPKPWVQEHCCVLPIRSHPGAFGFMRQNHTHEGVDIYCTERTPVYAIASGQCVWRAPFTGSLAGSAWWNETQAVLIQGTQCSFLYGEIDPVVQEGDAVNEGDLLGYVVAVLKKDKGWPRSMLHLEAYHPSTLRPINEWPRAQPKPQHLWDPTPWLVQEYEKENSMIDQVKNRIRNDKPE